MSREPLPVKCKSKNTALTCFVWRIYLVKVCKPVAPECSPPGMVKLLNIIIISFSQILSEVCHTAFTIAFSSKFIGNMPHQKPRMLGESLCQSRIDILNLFPVYRRGHTVIMSQSVMLSVVVGIHSHALRILLIKPRRTGSAGRSQDRMDSIRIEIVHYLLKPVKVIFTLLRLIHRP